MPTTTFSIFRLLAGASLGVLVSVSVANAQVQPNPPSLVTIDGQSIGDSPGNPLFFDDFNYVVGKLDAGGGSASGPARTAFTSRGWSTVKRMPTDGGSGGYIYTTTSIPGYSGQMPGLSGSGRVLCLEGLPTSVNRANGGINQTDFYLQYGTSDGPQGQIPGNVWFQFWVYINDYGSQRTHWANRNKLLYPSQTGTAPASGLENAWLHSIRPNSQDTDGSQPNALPYGPNAYSVTKLEQGTGTLNYSLATMTSDTAGYLGPNLDKSGGYTRPNRWELYKIHYDHASTNGTYEVWRRVMGGQWQKTTEWRGGVTPNFTWVTQSQLRAGHRVLKMPTTWGTAQSDDSTNYDAWLYMADFAMATREEDLPTYGSY